MAMSQTFFGVETVGVARVITRVRALPFLRSAGNLHTLGVRAAPVGRTRLGVVPARKPLRWARVDNYRRTQRRSASSIFSVSFLTAVRPFRAADTPDKDFTRFWFSRSVRNLAGLR